MGKRKLDLILLRNRKLKIFLKELLANLSIGKPCLFLEVEKIKYRKEILLDSFLNKGNITKDQLGNIELKQDCAFVAVPLTIANDLIEKLNNTRLKKKKVRVTLT